MHLLRQRQYGGAVPARVEELEFDRSGRLLSARKAAAGGGYASRADFAYDAVGRMESAVQTYADSTQYPLGYAYTVGVGDVHADLEYPSGRVATNTFDRRSRLESVFDGLGNGVQWTFDAGNRRVAAALSDEQIIALIGGDPWNPPSIRADLHMLNMETGECDVTIHCSSDVPPPTLVDPAVTCSLCQAPDDPNITQCRLQGPVEKVFEVVDGMLSVPTWTYNFTDSNSGDEYDVLVDNTGVEIQRNGEVVQTLTR